MAKFSSVVLGVMRVAPFVAGDAAPKAGKNSFASRMANRQGKAADLMPDQVPFDDADHKFDPAMFKDMPGMEGHEDLIKNMMAGGDHKGGLEGMEDMLGEHGGDWMKNLGLDGDHDFHKMMADMQKMHGDADSDEEEVDESGSLKAKKEHKKVEDMTPEEREQHEEKQKRKQERKEKAKKQQERMRELTKTNPLIGDNGEPDMKLLQEMMDPNYNPREDNRYHDIIKHTLKMADEDDDGHISINEHQNGIFGTITKMLSGDKDYHQLKEHLGHHPEKGLNIDDMAHHIVHSEHGDEL